MITGSKPAVVRVRHVTADRLESIAFQHPGTSISMGGGTPTLTINGVRYVGDQAEDDQ